jgi:hypothetical protein
MKKWIALLLSLFLLVGCAETIKYEREKPLDIPKLPSYTLPENPLKDVPPPAPFFIRKVSPGLWKECTKEESEATGYFPKELSKITLLLQYYASLLPQTENMVNVTVMVANKQIDLVMDEQIAKEFYREMWIDCQNARNKDKSLFGLEKYGLYGVIIGLIIEAAILAAH